MLSLSEPPRLLVVLAHPDDEVLALGSRLHRFAKSQAICVTDGAPADGRDAQAHGFATLAAYRAARRDELDQALQMAGLSPSWSKMPTLARTHNSPEVVGDQQAASVLRVLSEHVAAAIETLQPEAVLTHPYEGGHPDHDACAFAVHAARALLPAARDLPIIEAPFYHRGAHGMQCGSFLPGHSSGVEVSTMLTLEEQTRKRALLACFRSQQETLAQFGSEIESYRIAPAYDFSCPPHAGTLLYEEFGWAMNGKHFCALAAEALATLRLVPESVSA